MPVAPPRARLTLAFVALLAEGLHLAWEAAHGGIVTHHFFQSDALPGISNAWGLLVLPALAAWAAGRLPARGERWWPVAVGFACPCCSAPCWRWRSR